MTSAMTKQVVAILLLIAFSHLVWASVIRPASAWKAQQFDTRDAARQQVIQLERRISGLEREHRQLSQKEALDVVWTAQKMGEATARVQSAINTLARGNGLALRSITPTSPRELPLTNSVGFRIEAEVHLDRFVGFLRALEFNTPALVVEQAMIRRLNRLGEAAEQPILFTQIDLVAPVRLSEGDG